ncbi:MAG: porin [Rhodomicrobium sp.]
MKRIIICALALAGFAAAAQAGDLDIGSVKDPLPGTISWHGVTIYGTVDVDYAYQTNGRPNGSIVSDLEYTPFMPTRNYTGQQMSTITANALEQSKIGVKIEENIGYGWEAIGKTETGFNPMTGELSDGCSSFVQNAGIPYNQQTSTADSGRCGQAFNGVAYAGVSNASYGTLTVGRQQSFQLDSLAAYDPMALSYAFSLFGYSGTGAGSGSTEAARWDNSVKYVYQYGPVHAGAMYSSGGDGTGLYGTGYGFNVGGAYKGFSADGVYTKENAAVNLLTTANDTPGNPLSAAISNNETWSVMGKYTYDFGGGFKDEGPGSKLTFFAGYEHIDQSNSNDPVSEAAGGYAINPDNNYFTKDKILQFAWTGAKYELPSGWSFTGAYYYVDQSAFVSDNTKICTAGGATRLQCAGTYNQVSFLIDYAFNKHFDVYTGVTYAIAADGLAAGFDGTPCGVTGAPSCTVNNGLYKQTPGNATSIDTAAVVTGMRLRF